MDRPMIWMLGAVIAASMTVAGCGSSANKPATEAAVTVDKIEGSELKKLTLSEHAAHRLGLTTAEVTATAGDTTVPYSAILYDKKGATWAYTNPEGLVFVRTEVTVGRVADGVAYLEAGLDPGTKVVTVGAAELWGVETGVGGGH
jgi:outer membrane murein-binding lipoprotein Lpp